MSPALAGGFFTTSTTWEAPCAQGQWHFYLSGHWLQALPRASWTGGKRGCKGDLWVAVVQHKLWTEWGEEVGKADGPSMEQLRLSGPLTTREARESPALSTAWEPPLRLAGPHPRLLGERRGSFCYTWMGWGPQEFRLPLLWQKVFWARVFLGSLMCSLVGTAKAFIC